MQGTVSKVASKVQNNYTLARVVQNGKRRMSLGELGRVPYHTFATPRRNSIIAEAPTARRNSTNSFYTALLNNNAKSVVQTIDALSGFKLPKEIVWLLGAPGAGKGTNSAHVAQTCGVQAPTIVMSSLLENPECKRIKDAGGMVDDATVFKALLEELSKPQYRDGAIVDGFPRTKEQAEWLRTMHGSLSETGVAPKFTFVMLSLSEETSVARQLSRGNTIRELNSVRQMSGLEPIEVRNTDVSEAAARTRYRLFAEQYDAVTQLSSDFRLAVVDADTSIDTVRHRLTATLGKPITSNPTHTARHEGYSPMANFGSLAFA